MTRYFLTLSVALVIAKYLAPRLFRFFDRRKTAARFASTNSPVPTDHSFAHQHTAAQMSPQEIFDFLSASTLTAESPRDALLQLVSTYEVPTHFRQACETHLSSTEPFAQVVQNLNHDLARTNLREFGVLLAASVSGGVFVSSALRHAAEVMRSEESLRRLVTTQTAHARITLRALSALPVGFLVLGALMSGAFRSALFTPVSLFCLVTATGLSACGWWWASRLIATVWHSDGEQQIHALSMSLCVSLSAGHTVTDACLNLRAVNACGLHIAESLDGGQPLETALDCLIQHHGELGIVLKRALIESMSSGLSLSESVGRISESLRQLRTASVASRTHQLATKLSMPIVLCLLPSFALAVLIPLLVASVSSLAAST